MTRASASTSVEQADVVSTLLATKAPIITASQLATMRQAQEYNPHVTISPAVEGNLITIARKFNVGALDLTASTIATNSSTVVDTTDGPSPLGG